MTHNLLPALPMCANDGTSHHAVMPATLRDAIRDRQYRNSRAHAQAIEIVSKWNSDSKAWLDAWTYLQYSDAQMQADREEAAAAFQASIAALGI